MAGMEFLGGAIKVGQGLGLARHAGSASSQNFDEVRRISALKRYEILDTASEIAFDDLTALAAHICATPIALISFVDENRLWFKSEIGFQRAEIPRQHAFCADAIFDPLNVMQVRDASLDNRFAPSQYVQGAPNLRFYAGAPLITPEGHALGTICVMDSVARTLSAAQCEALEAFSRQVMAQLELRRNIAGLRSTIGELARAQRDLTHARTSVNRAKQSRSRFLANIVSEIRTPLNIVMGFAQLLRADEIDSAAQSTANSANAAGTSSEALVERQHYVKQIIEGGVALEEVVTHLSTLSALDNRAVSVNPSQLTLQPFLNDIVIAHQMARRIAEAKINVTVDVASNVPDIIQVDRPKLAQILIALLENAIRFARLDSTVTISVAHFAGLSNRAVAITDTLRISVRDDGDLIPPSQLDAVFFGLESSVERTAARGGVRVLQTGLGVSAAKSLANLMDGDIVVQSTVEMGTQFVVSLPIASAAIAAAPKLRYSTPVGGSVAAFATASVAAAQSDAPAVYKSTYFGDNLVLVAEDDEISRMMIGTMLRKRGIEAKLVKNGAEAVAEALRSKPDLMLMDFHMPHMNGIEAMREIRAQAEFENVPIVIMSADTQAMEHRGLVAGASAVMTKPIDLAKLDPILQRFLRVAPLAVI